jgi:M6 family metalloprotease-like protein
LVIPVDFPRYRASTNPQIDFASLASSSNAYFRAVSYGNLGFDFTIANRYFTMPINPEDYRSSAWQSNLEPYFLDGLRAAADDFTLNNFDVVYVISLQTIPTNVISPGPAFFGPFQTSSGVVNLGSAAGAFGNELNQWRWLVHETGHLLGLVDLYGWVGSYVDDDDRHRFFGDWDIMSQNWKDSPIELNGWFRFQLGWLGENQVRCTTSPLILDNQKLVFGLTPIEIKDAQPKIGVIRVSDQKAIVFEYRRNLGFDVLKKSEEGLLVYLVDGEKDSRTGPLQIQRRLGSTSKLLYDAALQVGDKLIIEGVEIAFVGKSDDVALVEVQK